MARVMAMTADGVPVREMAETLGMSKSKVHRMQTKAKAAGAAPPGHD